MLAKSGLGNKDLGHLWGLADADRDGKLSRHEFAVAMHLAACITGKKRLPLPRVLPSCLSLTTLGEAYCRKTTQASDEQGPMFRPATKSLSPVDVKKRASKKQKRTAGGGAQQELLHGTSGASIPEETDQNTVTITAIATARSTGESPTASFETAPASSEINTIALREDNPGVGPRNKNRVEGEIDGRDTIDEVTKTNKKRKKTKKTRKSRSTEKDVADELYAVSRAERGGYDVIFMQVHRFWGGWMGGRVGGGTVGKWFSVKWNGFRCFVGNGLRCVRLTIRHDRVCRFSA